jgi:hypothetical protein
MAGKQNFLRAIIDPKTPGEFIQAMSNPNSPFFKQLMNDLILQVMNNAIIELEIDSFIQQALVLEAKEKLEVSQQRARHYTEEKKRFQQIEEQQARQALEAKNEMLKNTENIADLFQLKEEIASQNTQLTQEIATLQKNIKTLTEKQPAIEKACDTAKEERINHIVDSLVNEKFINSKGEEVIFDEKHVEKLRPYIKAPTPFEHAKYNQGLIDKIIDSTSAGEEKEALSSRLLNEVVNNGANVATQLTILARGENPDGPPLMSSQLLAAIKMNKKLETPKRTPAEQEAFLAASRLLTEKRIAERQLQQKLSTQSANTQLLETVENKPEEKQENKSSHPR